MTLAAVLLLLTALPAWASNDDASGYDVRVLLRETSSTRGIDDLDVERCYGDIFDDDAVRAAMADRDVVFYCVVDARAMLPDPAPLFRTKVDGLRQVLDIAVDALASVLAEAAADAGLAVPA